MALNYGPLLRWFLIMVYIGFRIRGLLADHSIYFGQMGASKNYGPFCWESLSLRRIMLWLTRSFLEPPLFGSLYNETHNVFGYILRPYLWNPTNKRTSMGTPEHSRKIIGKCGPDAGKYVPITSMLCCWGSLIWVHSPLPLPRAVK